MIRASITRSVSALGRSFDTDLEVDGENGSIAEPNMASAHAATMTAYTSGVAGSLTATEGAGHGIITGDRIDMIWYETGVMKHRRGMVAGVVAGAVIPYSGGSGDNTPDLAGSAGITFAVMKPDSEPMVVTGNNVVFIGCNAAEAGIFTFCTAGDAECASVVLDSGQAYSWVLGEGITNPLAGDAVAKVYMSHGRVDGETVSGNNALLLHN